MTVRWGGPALALGIGLLAGSSVFAPARWWALAVDAGTQGRVQLVHPQGSVWRGEAGLLLHGDGGTLALPGGIAWRIGLSSKPALGVTLDLTLRCCAPQTWQWRLGRMEGAWAVESRPHRSTWDLAWLRALGSPWNTLGFQGTLELDVGVLRWPLSGTAAAGRTPPRGHWTADIIDLSAAVATVRPLGSYRLSGDLAGPSGPTIALSTLSGDLRLDGEGAWRRGRFHFQGLAQAAPDRLDALSNLLNLLGRRDGARAHLRLG